MITFRDKEKTFDFGPFPRNAYFLGTKLTH